MNSSAAAEVGGAWVWTAWNQNLLVLKQKLLMKTLALRSLLDLVSVWCHTLHAKVGLHET